MRISAALVTAAFLLAACQPKANPSEVAALKSEVSNLRQQVVVLQTQRVSQAAPAPVPPPKPPEKRSTYELVVSWPDKGGNDYRRSFDDEGRCEEARKAVFAENARRASESREQADREAPPGFHSIHVPQPPEASAVCIPV